jgi:hypothetical protein
LCLCCAHRRPPRSPVPIRISRPHIRANRIRLIPCAIIARSIMQWTLREHRCLQFATRNRSRPALWWLQIRRLRNLPRNHPRNHPAILLLHLRRRTNRAKNLDALAASQRKKLPRRSASLKSSHLLRAADITRAIQMGSGTPTRLRQCRSFSPPMASTRAAS